MDFEDDPLEEVDFLAETLFHSHLDGVQDDEDLDNPVDLQPDPYSLQLSFLDSYNSLADRVRLLSGWDTQTLARAYQDKFEGVSGGTPEQYQNLEDCVNSLGLQVWEVDLPPTVHGVMQPVLNEIQVDVKMSLSNKIRITGHELAHYILHSNPFTTDRSLDGELEVEAEAVAYLVCQEAGIDNNQVSEFYIAHWIAAEGLDFDEVMLHAEESVLHAFNIFKDDINWSDTTIDVKAK